MTNDKLMPTCPICQYQHDIRTMVVKHIVGEHGKTPSEAREMLIFKREIDGE